MANSDMFGIQGCSNVEEDRSDRYRNNSKELDEWFYMCYYMDPQPQFDPTRWATPEDDEIFNVGDIPQKINGNLQTTAATSSISRTSIHKSVEGKERELKDLSEFISRMGLGLPKSQAPIEKKTEQVLITKSLPVKKLVHVRPTKMDIKKKEDDHVLNNKRKMTTSHCDFRGFEATKQRFHYLYDDRIEEAKKQKTMEIQQRMKQPVSKAKPKGKPSFIQKLKTMATHNKKHHNFQPPLVY